MSPSFTINLRSTLAAAGVALALSTALAAQQVKIDTGDSVAEGATLLPELRAELIASGDGQSVEVRRAASREERAAAYADVDLAAGDRILAIGGKRVRSAAELQAVYDGLSIGDQVELGVQRGDSRFIARFPKADPAALPQVHRMEVRFEGNPDDIAMLMGLGVVLSKQEDDSLQVIALMPGEPVAEHFQKGDTLVSVNGDPVPSAGTLQELWTALPVGAEVAFALRRGDQSLSFTVAKPEFKGRVVRH